MIRKIIGNRSFLVVAVILLFGSTLIGCGSDEDSAPPEEEITEIATALVEDLDGGDFESAVERFNEEMKNAMPKELLGQTWEQLEGQVGAFVTIEGNREETVQGYDVVFVTSEFENALIDIRVVFDEEKRVAGLFFEPAADPSAKDWEAPEYVDSGAFREEEVTFGEDPWRISGTLTIPEGNGPHPAVILVHGSGPSDRDSTIGPNKPLKDLAEGLSSSGIAVLRYDKRTYTYQAELRDTPGDFTVREETTEDALEAVSYLTGREEIAGEEIFLAGHSLGGKLAPRIAADTEDLKGLILLAAPARPLSELMLIQTEYLIDHEDRHDEEVELELDELRRQVERVQDPDLPRDTPREEILGVPASYWLDLQQYDALETAKELPLPIMVVQGERDYQVTTEDFEMWREALGDEQGSFYRYSDLNHLLMPGEGLSLPSEYSEVNHVDEAVITDIAEWIKTLSE